MRRGIGPVRSLDPGRLFEGFLRQVNAMVEQMDTAVTHNMLNQIILLQSKLQKEVGAEGARGW